MSDLFEKVEKAKKEWESSIDVISEGVAVYESHTLTILRANWTLANFFDTTPHKLAGENLHLLICGCLEPLCPIRSLLSSTHAEFMEYEPKIPEKLWTLSTYPVPSAQNHTGYNVLVIRDITHERILQHQMLEAEAKASMIRTVANLAQQTGPSLTNLQQNLDIANRWVDQLRNALIDYRVALQTISVSQLPLSELSWENIESRHHVEFLLQDFEGLLDQSNHLMEQITSAITNLSELQVESLHIHSCDLNMIVENSINAVWDEIRYKAHIERYYGRVPLISCDSLRIQTGLVELIINLVQTFHSPKEIAVQTRAQEEWAEIIVTTSVRKKSKSELDTSPLSEEGFETQIRPKLSTTYGVIEEHGGKVQIDHHRPDRFSIILMLPITNP